ncbi:MAG TPA: M48 family metalloprotease [bacterium]|nr:M48 family metalloprotease [bacterium]
MRLTKPVTRDHGTAAGIHGAHRVRRVCAGAFVIGALVGAFLTPGETLTFPSTADEVKLGTQIDKQIESQYRVVSDPAQVSRLNRIGDVMDKVVERQDLTYHFLIVSSPIVNSFAIPGGWVYVTEGMMRFVRSDDELAAVLGHELTHINHRHYYIQQDRLNHMTPAMIIGLAVAVLAQSPGPLMAEQAVVQGTMSTYQRDLEQDADLTSVASLTKTPYSPVAMLTVMEHLAQAARLSGQPPAAGTISADHPEPAERAAYIKADLERRHIPIIRRIPEGYLRIALDPAAATGDQPVTIRVEGQPVLTLGATVGGQTPSQRAQAVVARLNQFFNEDPAPYDVHVATLAGRTTVLGREIGLYDVTPEDAAYDHLDPSALAQSVRSSLAQVIGGAPYNRGY